jgi:uncharacterized membrane protein
MNPAKWVSRILPPLVLALVVLFVLRNIWLPAQNGDTYPWASDTLGHLVKAEYLQQEIAQGHWYPNLFPYWYNGLQMLRYHPPLPYYVLIALNFVTRDMLVAGHWYVVLTTVLSGWSFLLFARWVGMAPATLGALLFALAPDNLRVAFAEGNLPRALATALLPALTYCVLCLLGEEGRRRHAVIGALLVALIIVSHAMMGAIFGVGLGLVSVVLFLLRGGPFRRLFRALATLAIGLALSGWWLLPSLTGGITELNQSAVTEALAIFPLTTYLNPLLRYHDHEILYVGLALTMVLLLSVWRHEGRQPLALAFLVVGFVTVLISTPGFNEIFNALPAHQLFWPIRFLSFSMLALTVSLVFQMAQWQKSPYGVWVMLSLALVLYVDLVPSFELLFRAPPPHALLTIAAELPQQTGWRQATLDFSRLGSAASYIFTAQGGREQVFGWAYQGARTATNVAGLNSALENGFWNYALTSLDRLGADDVVVLHADPLLQPFSPVLIDKGFKHVWGDNRVSLYHRDGAPRAYRVDKRTLGIGAGAQNFAVLFPSLTWGSSRFVDDYDVQYLSQFRLVILSAFNWRDQSRAEAIIRAYAEQGGEVLVDLTGSPHDPLAREPRFLNVYGEFVRFSSASTVNLNAEGQTKTLLPFAEGEWQAVAPQGKLENVVTFDYHGVVGTALGFMQRGKGRIWFVGLNLPFHTLLTKDPVGLDILSRVMTVPAWHTPEPSYVPLQNYRADRDGYVFEYEMTESGDIVVPIADHGGTAVRVDGQLIANHSLFNFVSFTAPAGRHRVQITFQPTSIYTLGLIVSGVGVGISIGLVLWWRKVGEYAINQAQATGRVDWRAYPERSRGTRM